MRISSITEPLSRRAHYPARRPEYGDGECIQTPHAGAGRAEAACPQRRLDGRKQEISGRYLSEDERVLIVDRHGQGETVRSITAALDRSPSTIGREVRRDAIRAVGRTDRSERIGSPRPDGLGPEGEAGRRAGVARVRPGRAEETVEPGADLP